MKVFSEPIVKRKFVCILLGISFGFLCAYMASTSPDAAADFWWSPLMWGIVFNRFLIGFVIVMAGPWNYCKVLKRKRWASLRGLVIGGLVSVDMAIGALISPMDPATAMNIFWLTILTGAIYGLIIDFAATRLFGDGKKLTEGWSK